MNRNLPYKFPACYSMRHTRYGVIEPVSVYKNRCSVIRVEKLRGTITEPLSDAALSLAYEHMKRANTDDKYAVTQYEADMSHDKLYKDAKLR